jgi:hypothetical protein
MICNAILTPIVLIIRTFIQILRTIVRTVCGWVSTVIKTIKTIVEKICKWLPWPLDKLCDLVTKTIEVFETVWNWVCENILETIVDIIEIVLEYIIYILKWVCWLIDWVIRFPDLILCWLGVETRRYISVCVKVLTDDAMVPGVPLTEVEAELQQAARIFEKCNITLVVCSIELVRKPEYLDGIDCGVGGLFKRFFTWFSNNTCGCCSSITIYYVRSISGARGCAYPGTDWVAIGKDGTGNSIAHEIGHLADMWGHNNDPNNLMYGKGAGSEVTHNQCCKIRTARFSLGYPLCRAARNAIRQDSQRDGDHDHGGGHDH